MSQSPRPKITIEDLLRVKRAERPGPEFWSRFESELRAKQLAAIVEKPSGWRMGLDSFLAHRLALGGVAACALVSIAAVNHFSAPEPVIAEASLALAPAAAAPATASIPSSPAFAAVEPTQPPVAAVEPVQESVPVLMAVAPAPAEAPAAALGAVALSAVGVQEEIAIPDARVANAIPERVVLPELNPALLASNHPVEASVIPASAKSDLGAETQGAGNNLLAAVGFPAGFRPSAQVNSNVYARPMPLPNKIRGTELKDLERRLNSL